MSTQPDTPEIAQESSRNHRFGGLSRTGVVLAMLIVLPLWILVAIPGEEVGRGSFESCTIRHHGWPFTHQRTVKFLFTESQLAVLQNKSLAWNIDNAAREQLCKSKQQRPSWFDSAGELYLIQVRANEHDSSFGGNYASHFWSDERNWPIAESASGFEAQISWLGLIGNLATLLVIVGLIAKLIDFRRRRRWLSISLFELAIVLPIIGVAIAIVVSEHRRAAKEQELVKTLFRSGGGPVERRSPAIPRVLFNLFDHRVSLPGSSVSLFAPVESLTCSSWEFKPHDFPNLKKLTVQLGNLEPQGAQLERIAQINCFPKLELLVLHQVNSSGRLWLDENSGRLPKKVHENP